MKQVMAVAAVMATLFVGAEATTSRWLGTGGDNKWANADNWEGGVVPGACKYESVTNDGLAVTAVFGPVAEGAATTIDLSNVLAVSNMTIIAGAPAFVFGKSATDAYYPHSNGGVTIEEGVATDQTFRRLFPAKWGPADGIKEANGNNNTTKSHYYHNGSGEFVVHAFLNSYNHSTYLHGSGTFVITNNVTSSGGFLYDYTAGRLVLGNTSGTGTFKSFANSDTLSAGSLHTVEIPEGENFCVRDWASGGLTVLNAECNLLYTGGGSFYFRNSSTTLTEAAHNYKFYVKSGFTATFDVDIMAGSYYSTPSPALLLTPLFLRHTGAGTVVLKKKFLAATGFTTAGFYTFRDSAGGTLRLSKMGNLGQGGEDGYNFGELEPVFNKDGTIEWTGDGDSVNRTIGFNNAVIATLKNSGTGKLVYTGTVTQGVDNCTIKLNAATAPIEFRGVKGSAKNLKLSVAGTDTVTVADLGLFSAVAIAGNTLKVEAASGTLTNLNFQTSASTSRVILPENCDLVVKGATTQNNSAKIDFIVPSTSSLTFYQHAAGDIVAWCMVNGSACYSDANGLLHSYRTEWKSAVSGAWTDAANWSAEAVPGAKSGVFITATGADYTVATDGTLPGMPSSVTLGTGEADHTATLSVAKDLGLTNCYFSVTKGGEVLVDGATFTLYGADYLANAIDGGRVVVTNGGDVRIPSNFRVTGELVISDGCGMRANDGGTRSPEVSPKQAGETARIAFLGAPGAKNTLNSGCLYAGGTKGGTVKVDLHGTGTSNFTPGTDGSGNGIFGWYLGVGDGLTVTDFTGGYVNSGNWGVRVGSTSKCSAPVAGECFPTGVVTMTGGKLSYSGWNNAAEASYCGLIVGDGALVSTAGNATHAYGEFNLEDGTLVSNCGYIMVGVGQAEGVFNQSGGSVSHNSTSFSSTKYFKPDGTANYVLDVYIGLAGGRGTYTQTGGSFYSAREVYVGGRPFADMGRSTNGTLSASYHDRTRQDAKGSLRLRGGTFSASKRITVGAWGEGEVEIGNAGYLSGTMLILSNATASVLKAQVDDNTRRAVVDSTTGGVNLSNKLLLTAGSKLVIDATAATRPIAGWRQIVKCTSVEGEFGEVEILVPEALSAADRRRIAEGEIAYSRNGAPGLWYRSAPRGVTVIIR